MRSLFINQSSIYAKLTMAIEPEVETKCFQSHPKLF